MARSRRPTSGSSARSGSSQVRAVDSVALVIGRMDRRSQRPRPSRSPSRPNTRGVTDELEVEQGWGRYGDGAGTIWDGGGLAGDKRGYRTAIAIAAPYHVAINYGSVGSCAHSPAHDRTHGSRASAVDTSGCRDRPRIRRPRGGSRRPARGDRSAGGWTSTGAREVATGAEARRSMAAAGPGTRSTSPTRVLLILGELKKESQRGVAPQGLLRLPACEVT
jgi:hypothetical protein